MATICPKDSSAASDAEVSAPIAFYAWLRLYVETKFEVLSHSEQDNSANWVYCLFGKFRLKWSKRMKLHPSSLDRSCVNI
jgi:hypothetical protein